eukprot:gnl/Trimastix_PCT/758.p1 GENE.gnl/Trimastix_PCT/758~~gnl/Trimastix_PCT/758.p1  ORF type:complete len:194 (+),score=50.56 gnl/Trimastix_PCT/758:58-639(+)
MWARFLVVVLSVFCIFASASSPSLLIRKTFDEENHPGQNFPMKVKIDLYNIGPSEVYDVHLRDWWNDKFTLSPDSSFEASWESIPPTTNVSHTIELTPHINGVMRLAPVTVSYRASQEEEPKILRSQPFRPAYILSEVEYRRFVLPHTMHIGIFAGLIAAAALLPFMAWKALHNSVARAQAEKKLKKGKKSPK